jgi:hypothetical protein
MKKLTNYFFINTKINNKMNKPTFTAIIFFSDRSPAKYRNLQNLISFKKFVLGRYPSAMYYNLYDKKTKAYSGREYLKDYNQANNSSAWNEYLAK